MSLSQVMKTLGIKKGRIMYMLKTTGQLKGKQNKEGAWEVDAKSVAAYRQVQLARAKGKSKAAPKTKAASKPVKKPVRKSQPEMEEDDGETEEE